jgi:hypothetical protein
VEPTSWAPASTGPWEHPKNVKDCVIDALQGCVIVALKGCVIVVLQGCVIVALQGCVIFALRERLRDCCVAWLRDCAMLDRGSTLKMSNSLQKCIPKKFAF